MALRIAEMLASGLLVLLGTLAGAFLQSMLQRKREILKSTLDLRIQTYSEVCMKVIPLLRVDIAADTERKEGWPKGVALTRVRVGNVSKTDWPKVVAELQSAVFKAQLVASSSLAAEMGSLLIAAERLMTIISREESEFLDTSQSTAEQFLAWREVAWSGIVNGMRLELGLATETNWERAEQRASH